jgi:2-(1,2-epoxy-1,2-dihydrophenyl)acetyl-CoA isomerase
MQFESIILEKSDNLGIIRMNRTKELNTLNFSLVEDILKALEICADDPDTKVIVITGSGKAFCAGGDVVTFKNSEDMGDTVRQMTKAFDPLISGIRRTLKPVIAMINGIVMGAGISLAAACDLRICAASAQFRQAYTSVGLVPDGAWSLMVPLLIGFGKAHELILLDPMFDAPKALEMGLVNEVVADEKLEETTRNRALKIARGPLKAFALAKENLNQAFAGLLESQLEKERLGIMKAARTQDAAEGVSAVLEKRKPNFIGS